MKKNEGLISRRNIVPRYLKFRVPWENITYATILQKPSVFAWNMNIFVFLHETAR